MIVHIQNTNDLLQSPWFLQYVVRSKTQTTITLCIKNMFGEKGNDLSSNSQVRTLQVVREQSVRFYRKSWLTKNGMVNEKLVWKMG